MTGSGRLDAVGVALDPAAWGPGARPDRLDVFDPRARLLVTALFAAAVVSLTALEVAFSALLIAASLAWLGGVSVGRLRYLLPLELLMLLLLLTLPLTVPGRPLFVLGPITASGEGLALAGLILLRANAVALGLFGLVGAIGSSQTVHALARLGVPSKLCQLLLLTLRQIALVGNEYQRMRSAMRARAFVARTDRHSWRALGWLIGMLLVRSLERGRRVGDAMRCRGFAGSWTLLRGRAWQLPDSLFLAIGVAVCIGLLVLDRWPAGA